MLSEVNMPDGSRSLDHRLIECRPDLSVAPTVRQLLESAGQSLSPGQTSTKRLIYRAIALLDRDPAEAVLRPADGRSGGGLAPWQARRVSEFIDRNFASPLPMEKLAAVVNLSRCHFCRAFK